MSEFTQDDFDTIMREEPKDDDMLFEDEPTTLLNQPGRTFGELSAVDVEGTGKGQGHDNWTIDDEKSGSPAFNESTFNPQQMLNTMGELDKFEQFQDEYAKPHPKKKQVSMRQVNPLFHKSKVKFDEDKNKTYLYDQHSLDHYYRERERRARKKAERNKKKGGKRRKKRTRKKRGGLIEPFPVHLIPAQSRIDYDTDENVKNWLNEWWIERTDLQRTRIAHGADGRAFQVWVDTTIFLLRQHQEQQQGGKKRRRKTRRRKINCGSITVKLKYKSRN